MNNRFRFSCETFPRAVRWIISLGLTVVVVVALVGVWMSRYRRVDSFKELDAEVVGSDFRLYFRYPGEDRVLHTPDDRSGTRDFYVPAGAAVRLRLNSRDFIYLVEIPAVGLYEVAVPDLDFDARFVAPAEGEHELLGSQMCGYNHPELLGNLIVQSPADFRQTMKRLSTTP